jgi:hypothetical protein
MKKNKMAMIALTLMLLQTNVQALECQGDECFQLECATNNQENCYLSADVETAQKALLEIKAKLKDKEFALEEKVLLTAVGAAAGGIAGSAYASRAAFAIQAQENQLLAQTIAKQSKLITRAVELAFSKEIETVVGGIVQHNSQLSQAGKSMYASEAVAGHVTDYLNNSEVKKRILTTLERALTGGNGVKGAKEMANLIYHQVLRDAGPIISSKWHENAYHMLKGWSGKVNLGSVITNSIIKQTLPFLVNTSAKRLVQLRTVTLGTGLWGRCKTFLGNGGWKAGATIGSVLGSSIFFTMIDAAPVADGTLRGYYARAPQELLNASDEEARHMLEQHASIRNSVVSWNQMLQDAQHSEE